MVIPQILEIKNNAVSLASEILFYF